MAHLDPTPERDRVAFVTGAASGLGRAMAVAMLRAGFKVAALDVQPIDAAGLGAEVGVDSPARLVPLEADLTQSGALPAALTCAEDRLGRIDILVNNAGISPQEVRRDFLKRPVRFWEHDEVATRRFFEINGIAPYLACCALAPRMAERGWGRIINVTTSLGTMIRAGFAGYGGSKASLEAHSAVMAADLSGSGVTVNVLVPGGIADTGMIPAEAGFRRDALIAPAVMAAPVLWLVSDAAAAFTGRRIDAVAWDPCIRTAEAALAASAPIAWPAAVSRSKYPDGFVMPS